MEPLTDHDALRLLVAARYRELTEQENDALRAWMREGNN